MRIMVVEDDAAVARLIAEALTRNGHQISEYAHGGMALGAIVRGKFELLICDLMLPNIDGVQTIKMVRSQFPYLPVIVVSGMNRDEWEAKALDAGATCFLQKPIKLERLLREVKLVEDSQVDLRVAIVDPDRAHRERVDRELSSLGCSVNSFTVATDMLGAPEPTNWSVLLIDAKDTQLNDALTWAKGHGVASVAFYEESPDMSQDLLMRAGVSFCLTKPVDAEALVTQARFFVAPVVDGEPDIIAADAE